MDLESFFNILGPSTRRDLFISGVYLVRQAHILGSDGNQAFTRKSEKSGLRNTRKSKNPGVRTVQKSSELNILTVLNYVCTFAYRDG